MIEVTDKVTKIAYLECGVEIYKVGEIVVPVINDFFENISFSGNVLSLLFLDNLTLLTYLGLRREKMRVRNWNQRHLLHTHFYCHFLVQLDILGQEDGGEGAFANQFAKNVVVWSRSAPPFLRPGTTGLTGHGDAWGWLLFAFFIQKNIVISSQHF